MPEKLYTAAQIGELMGGKSARPVPAALYKHQAPAKAAGAAAVESVKEDTHGRNDFSRRPAAVSGPDGVEDRAGR